jgi:hypothetical protein
MRRPDPKLPISIGSKRGALKVAHSTIGSAPSGMRKKVIEGHPDADLPALSTKDVPGG